MLTAKQLLIITSNRSTPPWRMSSLRNIFRATPLSLRPLLNGLGGQNLALLELASKVSGVNHRQQRTAFESDSGCSALTAGTDLHAPSPLRV
jgi:hypothetical protein